MSAVERSWDALFLLRMDGDLSDIMADEDIILEYHGFKKVSDVGPINGCDSSCTSSELASWPSLAQLVL